MEPMKFTVLEIEMMDRLYLAEDGGMGLRMVAAADDAGPDGDRPPFPGQTLRTIADDNPTYFRAIWELVIRRAGFKRDGIEIKVSDYLHSLRSTQLGLFHRNPGRVERHNSFDEYSGIAMLAILFKLPQFADEICQRGEATGYIFNNVDPKDADARYWRQGIDVFQYKMASSRYCPTPYEFAWFILGTLWGLIRTPRTETSDVILVWSRVETLALLETQDMIKTKKTYMLGVYVMLGLTALITRLKWGGIKKILATYFGADHPIARISAS